MEKKEKLKKVVRILLMLLVSVTFKTSQTFFSKEVNTVVLKDNGIALTINLPDTIISVEKFSEDFAIVQIDDVQVTLEIERSTLKKQKKFNDSVAESMLENYPDTTKILPWEEHIFFGELYFLQSMYYGEDMDKKVIDAFSKLTNKYIYMITIRGDIQTPPELIEQFTEITIEETAREYDMSLLILAGGYFALGFLIISHQVWRKFTWIKSEGKIIDVVGMRKSVNITVTYFLLDGESVTSTCNISSISALPFYKNNYGGEVAIAYFSKNPKKFILLKNKMQYFLGIILLVFGCLYASLSSW